MSWSAGTFTRSNGVYSGSGVWASDEAAAVDIESARHDTHDQDLATGINSCIHKGGQNAATADLGMGGFKHTNVGVATARTHYGAVSQIQDSSFIWLGTTGGTATAQTASATPAITAYAAGQRFRAIVGGGLGSTNTAPTAHTININGIGAKNIVENYGSSNPTIGSWVAGSTIELQYDGTNFRLMNDAGGWQTWAPALTPSAGSAASIVYNVQSFRRYARTVDIKLYVTWTQNTSAAANMTIACPTVPSLTGQMFPTINNFVTANILGFGTVSALTGSGVITFSKYDSSTFGTGSSWLYCSGTYIAD